MRRRPKWPSDLERPSRKTFAPDTIRQGAALVLGADARAGVLFETAFRLGHSPVPLDGWSLASALGAQGIKASYDSCVAFLERLTAIANGEAPASTLEMRAQSAPEPAPRPAGDAARGRPRGRGRPGGRGHGHGRGSAAGRDRREQEP